MNIIDEVNRSHRSFALVIRGNPDDFANLMQMAKRNGLFIVYSKTSHLKLMIQEVPF
ncbi:MAG: hypothetical protein ACFFB7_03010 [Candidatus Sifarchaeia archaeon]